MDGYDLHRELADFAREVSDEDDIQHAVSRVTGLVMSHVPGADGAGVSLLGPKGRIETLGATDPYVEAADRFQHELGEGPCLDSIRTEEVVLARDLATDDRWTRWREPVVQQLGVHSMLALQLFVHDRGVGALNLYGKEPDAFSAGDILEAGFFAAHAAVAIAAAQKVDQLNEGLATRTVIGQAEGILMERYRLPAHRAFDLLVRTSQDSNVRLRAVAETVVRTRSLPDTEDPDSDQH